MVVGLQFRNGWCRKEFHYWGGSQNFPIPNVTLLGTVWEGTCFPEAVGSPASAPSPRCQHNNEFNTGDFSTCAQGTLIYFEFRNLDYSTWGEVPKRFLKCSGTLSRPTWWLTISKFDIGDFQLAPTGHWFILSFGSWNIRHEERFQTDF